MSQDSSHPRVLMLCIALLIGGPWLIWSKRGDYREAMAAYQAARGAPQVEYTLVGRHSEVRGSGKQRSTHYFLEFGLREPGAQAPPGVHVEVSESVYRAARNGERWRARLVQGQPLFDPLLTRREVDASRFASWAGSLMVIIALGLLWLHRSGRLYRPLWR